MNNFRNFYSPVLDYSVADYLYLPCYPATGVLPCYPATGDMRYYGYFSPPRLIGDNRVLISGHFRCQFLPCYANWAVLKHQAHQGTWWHLGKHDGTPRQSFQKLLTGAGPGAPRHQQKKARAMKLGWTNRAKSRAANRAMPAPKTAPLAPETQPTAPPRLVKLIATCAPLDIDDPQPAITILMPVED